MAFHVSKARFGELVEQALRELPPQFQEHLEHVPVQIEMRPSVRLLRELGLKRTGSCSVCTRVPA